VYAVILIPSERRLDELRAAVAAQDAGSSGGLGENVLSAIASIEHGDDTGLVRIDFGTAISRCPH
tara:strand:+ start:528 stop:722 length:195 start_codon:yes stop_codon:yes gene_type:complete